MSVGGNGFMYGVPIIMGIYLIFLLGIIAMAICGFIFLIRFLRAGTTAFNIYIDKNRNYQYGGQNFASSPNMQQNSPSNARDDSGKDSGTL